MFRSVTHHLTAWQQKRTAVRKLGLLDDRLLADVGTSRADIENFVRCATACDQTC